VVDVYEVIWRIIAPVDPDLADRLDVILNRRVASIRETPDGQTRPGQIERRQNPRRPDR
jgi:hypothetical protein